MLRRLAEAPKLSGTTGSLSSRSLPYVNITMNMLLPWPANRPPQADPALTQWFASLVEEVMGNAGKTLLQPDFEESSWIYVLLVRLVRDSSNEVRPVRPKRGVE